ncbi:CBS domain protein [Paenibacillus taihuensis]|uniref:CBS domain protein n=1 Tax=Paenibacillus taihuensis TaxID=1156355 RepID=A0A3D9S7J6_9BACL|nr:nucleotidyltransferase family protein [Paenibacillus taihuensis]REE84512.1 CBS domain protein [Paenibacillus taihuensis]
MRDWRKLLVTTDETILETLQVLDANAKQIVLVVDGDDKLRGTVTDGDVRRGILKGLSLNAPVTEVMNKNPIMIRMGEERETILAVMKSRQLRQVPIIDDKGRLVDIEFIDQFLEIPRNDHIVVLMAGGLGSRLAPLTNDCPKPLLKVGTKPILEVILDNFIAHGFHRFYISVNYKADMIKDYFGNGKKWNINIRYLQENERLGTAGALSLLPEPPDAPFIVMNGDLLTKVNFTHALQFHKETGSMATMCVREYEYQVPYGVVKVDNHRLQAIEEKPLQRFFISGGIYILDPDVLRLIPPKTFYDMPTLFEDLLRKDKPSSVFPIREYWMDIGRMDDYERANAEYAE